MAGAPRDPADGLPSRRLLLRAALAAGGLAGAGAVGGCRVRLQDDAPALPFLERRSIPDESLLVQSYRATSALAELAARVAHPVAAQVAPQHARQAAVIRGILTAGGVPSEAITGPTPSGPATGATPTPPPQPPADPAVLAQSELAALAPQALTALAAAVAHRPLLSAVTAHRAATAAVLGVAPAWPAAPALPFTVAATALDANRAARYAVQVAAAHLGGPSREQALATLATLDRRVAELTAAAAAIARPAPLGYRLPFSVAGPDDAVRLLATALGTLAADGLVSAPDLPVGSAAYVALVRLHAEAVLLAHPWGVALTAFPGLVDA